MRAVKGGIRRRAERWLVGLAMAALAFVLERFVARAIRRGAKAGAAARSGR